MRDFTPNETKKLEIFTKKVGKGINRFRMIDDGDKVLIGVSGGKDSLALSFALSARLYRIPVSYELTGLFINWREYPVSDDQWSALAAFFADLQIPLLRTEASMFPPSFKGRFDCYLCSRNKKRILFNEATRLGIGKIALAHHMDDVIETTLLNIFFHGEFSTMMPVQDFFSGKIKLIRPLCEVKEQEVARVTRRLQCPVLTINCPNRESNRRVVIKEMVTRLSKINRRVRENIYRTPWRIKEKYLPYSLHRE